MSRVQTPFGVLAVVIAVTAAQSSSGQLYERIAEANVFGLKPPTSIVPITTVEPLPKVILAGITTLGQRRALLKVQYPPRPPQPGRELSCILAEGQREGAVSVLDINEREAQVRVDVCGTPLVLTLGKTAPE
jgi:hypothetical protein